MLDLHADVLPPLPSPGLAYFEAQALNRRAPTTTPSTTIEKGKGRAQEDELLDLDFLSDIHASELYKKLHRCALRQDASDRRDTPEPPKRVRYASSEQHSRSDASTSKLPLDEELVWSGATVVWSKGTAIHKVYNFLEGEPKHREVQQALFAWFGVPAAPSPSSETTGSSAKAGPQHLSNSVSPPHRTAGKDVVDLFGPFSHPQPPPWSDDNARSLRAAAVASTHTSEARVRCLCVLFHDSLIVYYPSGESRTVSFDDANGSSTIRVKKLWALEKGLLIEKTPTQAVVRMAHPCHHVAPSLFTLLDPFEDYRPVSKRSVTPPVAEEIISEDMKLFSDPDEHVIYTGQKSTTQDVRHLPLAVSANTQKGKISVWQYTTERVSVASQLQSLKDRLGLAPVKTNGLAAEVVSDHPSEPHVSVGKRRRRSSGGTTLPGGTGVATEKLHSRPDINRRSSILDARRRSTNPQLASTADFLASMGTSAIPGNAFPMSAAVTNGETGSTTIPERLQNRRTSTVAVSAMMNRRSSTARHDLSVSMDRMALNNALLHPTSVPSTMVGAAMRDDIDPGLANRHGDIERETTFQYEPVEHSLAASDVCLTRLLTLDTNGLGPEDLADVQVEVFNEQPATCLLGVYVPRQHTVFLYQMTSSGMTVVHALRPDSYDLLNFSPGDAATLTTSAGPDINVHLNKQVRNTCGSHHRFLFDAQPTSPVAIEALRILREILPPRTFLEVQLSFLAVRRSSSHGRDVYTDEKEMTALTAALVPSKHGPQTSQAQEVSAWELLCGEVKSTGSHARIASIESGQLGVVLLALHILVEELKMLKRRQHEVPLLAGLVQHVANHLGYQDYSDAAYRNGAPCTPASAPVSHATLPPFDALSALSDIVKGRKPIIPFARLDEVTKVVNPKWQRQSIELYPVLQGLLQLYAIFNEDAFNEDAGPAKSRNAVSERIVLLCTSLGWTSDDLLELSVAVSLPIREAVRQCQLATPEQWPQDAYKLLGRADQTMLAEEHTDRTKATSVKKRLYYVIDQVCDPNRNSKPISHPQHHIRRKNKEKASRFSNDLRLDDVYRMLHYTSPIIIKLPTGPDITEANLPAEQQKTLVYYSNRTLSLPVGNAIFLFRAAARPRSQATSIPKIDLSAKFIPQPAVVQLSAESLAPEQKTWPYFHSGVAVALHVAWGRDDFDASEYIFNKPHELNARHAGLLLGLGLTGQIRSLGTFQAFKYMDPKHEYTSVGLLLGLGTAYLGTADPKVTSALAVHISALHPPSALHLNISLIIQSSALVGFGFLHIATRNRKLADSILRDMTKIHLLGTEHPDGCREGYALASAFSYGLIMLGRGNDDLGPGDSDVRDTFQYLLHGDRTTNLPGARKNVDGNLDVAVTSPAAGVALALSFMRSNRKDLAEMLEIPQSPDRLDHVRSDLILLRTVCRCLIMWDSVKPTKTFVESMVPSFILKGLARRQKSGITLSYDYDLAYWNIAAGASLAIGLKYAGTAKGLAHATLIELLDRLNKVTASTAVTASLRTKLSKHSLQNCISVVCLALSAVMAGTGELNVLRRLRVMHGQVSPSVDYGQHLASHMALGLLFLGKGRYTLGTSKLATAALFCAFYPVFPSSPTANRFHLQAFRHLWVLAVEPRCLIAKDADSGKSVYLPLKLRLHERDDENMRDTVTSQKLVAPTLIPGLESIESIQTDSPRYWPMSLNFAKSRSHLEAFLRHQTLYVKRKAGHLSYLSDPRGIRSVFTQSKSEGGTSVLDGGDSTRLVAVDVGNLWRLISAFTAFSPMTLGELHYICAAPNSHTTTEGTKRLSAFMASAIMESLTTDKPEAQELYRHLYLSSIRSFEECEAVQDILELHFLADFYKESTFNRLFPSPGTSRRQSLVGRAFVESSIAALRKKASLVLTRQDVQASLLAYSSLSAPQGDLYNPLQRPIIAAIGLPHHRLLQQLQGLVRQTRMRMQSSDEGVWRITLGLLLRKVLGQISGDQADPVLIELLVEAWAISS